jgi:hypothetical protein
MSRVCQRSSEADPGRIKWSQAWCVRHPANVSGTVHGAMSAGRQVSGPPRLRWGLADLAGAVRGLGRCLAFEKVLDVPQATNELPSQVGLDELF